MTETDPKPEEPTWHSVADDTIVWTRWDGDRFIAFHRPSGITHFLNAASAVLIRELLVEPAGADSVARAFERANEDADWDAHLAEITAMLEHLEHLGLIQRA